HRARLHEVLLVRYTDTWSLLPILEFTAGRENINDKERLSVCKGDARISGRRCSQRNRAGTTSAILPRLAAFCPTFRPDLCLLAAWCAPVEQRNEPMSTEFQGLPGTLPVGLGPCAVMESENFRPNHRELSPGAQEFLECLVRLQLLSAVDA